MSPTRPEQPEHPDVSSTELIGGVEKRALNIVAADPEWPNKYREHERRLRSALGPAGRDIQHIGSTAVPGLAAKPIIDILVTVSDVVAEDEYLPRLLEAGYLLRVREPGHRMFRTTDLDVHVHVLASGDPDADDYLLLRDHLRDHPVDRDRYEQVKRSLVTREWPDMNAYADAKSDIIAQLKAAARDAAAGHR